MRTTFLHSVVAVLTAVSICGCSNSSKSATSSADQTASSTETSAASAAPDAASSAAQQPASGAAIPIYPNNTSVSSNPGNLGVGKLPASAKIYSTSDDFAKVKAWYRGQLKGAPEMASPGKEKTMDTFLVGHGPSGMAVMIQSMSGETWIVIAPPG
jgi:hypothetical protein